MWLVRTRALGSLVDGPCTKGEVTTMLGTPMGITTTTDMDYAGVTVANRKLVSVIFRF